MTNKSEKAYKTIGEVSKMLNLTSGISKKSNNHTLRYWETQFKQIKPKIINKEVGDIITTLTDRLDAQNVENLEGFLGSIVGRRGINNTID